MIYGFVGTISDLQEAPLRGNGKTISMTYYLYEEFKAGRDIYTNYNTTFSQFIDTEEIANKIIGGELDKLVLGIDEIQQILENLGKNKYSAFMGQLINESRKDELDIFFTTQRWLNLLRRFRVQVDRVLYPKKYHNDTKDFCDIDKCKRDHFIYVHCGIPFIRESLTVFDCVEIGRLYDTKQRLVQESER